MTLAFTFAEPLLLLGLLAVAIPLLLHLLARSRAQEMLFPTLRFLRISMQKTARRRRIQHLMLMILRMALLGLLALAVAEPISQAIGGWTGGRNYACILIVDNSMSMSALTGGGASLPGAGGTGAAPGGAAARSGSSSSRLEKARSEAKALLSGADRPAVAALWTTNGPAGEGGLTDHLDQLREQADRIAPSFAKAAIAPRVAAALAELRKQSVPQKAIAVFSDLQKVSFEDLLAADDLAKAQDVHLLVVDAADRAANNVAVTDVKVEGRAIVDQLQTVTATVENSSPAERVVDLGLLVRGEAVGQKVRLTLSAAGADGSAAAAKFNWWPREAGALVGEVRIDETDDLPQDNVRRFAVAVGGRIQALVVRGPAAEARQPSSDPAWMLELALNPFSDAATPWFIQTRTIEADQFTSASLQGEALRPADGPAVGLGAGGGAEGPEIVFLCDVPKFTSEQAAALEAMAAGGGTVVLFLGPNVDVKNYNEVLGRQGGVGESLLPAPIAPAVGDVGPASAALFLKWVDLEHPYFKGLYKDLSDVKEDIRGFVQRHYPLGPISRGAVELVRLESNEPLIVTKPYGRGNVVLCATSAAPGWSNLPATSLFPPMVIRMSMLARPAATAELNFLAGAPATIRPRGAGAPLGPEGRAPRPGEANEVTVTVTPPPPIGVGLAGDGKAQPVTMRAVRTSEGLVARFADTSIAGVYQWRASSLSGNDRAPSGSAAAGGNEYGSFVVNPPPAESQLQALTPEELRQALATKGFSHVYIGRTFAEASEAALAAAQKRNWWDVLAAAAIVALVLESLVANRSRKHLESAIPAHLNPKIAA